MTANWKVPEKVTTLPRDTPAPIPMLATMPALVIDKSLEVKSTNQSLTVNGAVYAGSGIATGELVADVEPPMFVAVASTSTVLPSSDC